MQSVGTEDTKMTKVFPAAGAVNEGLPIWFCVLPAGISGRRESVGVQFPSTPDSGGQRKRSSMMAMQVQTSAEILRPLSQENSKKETRHGKGSRCPWFDRSCYCHYPGVAPEGDGE
jgi:hypothetical protein